MKKIIALITVLLALLFAGCSAPDNDPGKENADAGSDAQMSPLEEQVLSIGLEGFTEMTKDELIATLGEPDEADEYSGYYHMLYYFADPETAPGSWITVDYYLPPSSDSFGGEVSGNAYGEYPISVSTGDASIFDLRCPIYWFLDESASDMTEQSYIDKLCESNIVYSKGTPLPGDTEAVIHFTYDSLYYIYTSDYRYTITVDSYDGACGVTLHEVVSLNRNIFWNRDEFSFNSLDIGSIELSDLLGKTFEQVLEEFPILTALNMDIWGDQVQFSRDTFVLYATLYDGCITSVDISVYDLSNDGSGILSDVSLFGSPLSATQDETAEHMRKLGYTVSSNNNYFALGYITVEVSQGDSSSAVHLEDHSSDPYYEPVEDAATRAKTALEEYFLSNLVSHGCGSIFADLNHDGVDELLVTSAGEYDANVLTIYTAQDGEIVELYRMEHSDAYMAGYGTKYLYTEDGVDYLLDIPVQISYTVPNCYTIFYFDENGQQVVFREESTSDGADSAVVDANKAKYLEQAILLISHDERYQSNVCDISEWKPADLLDVICYPERVAREVLGDLYDTTVKVWINRPDPFSDGGSGLPSEMLNKVSYLTTSSPNVSVGGATVGMTEDEFLAILAPLCDPKFVQSGSPALNMDGTVLEGTYYTTHVFYTLDNGVVSEITLAVELGTPA